MHILTFLSHFLSHGTNLVTFLTPQKPSNTKGFRDWSKICHIFQNFVPSLSRVCHVHKPRGMRFIHKIYINVTNIYKSLTKFF